MAKYNERNKTFMNGRAKIGYVVILDLPENEQVPFTKWLDGQTRPIVEQEGLERKSYCAYKWDYDRWKEAFDKGIVANIYD